MTYEELREQGPAAFAHRTGRTQYWELLEGERQSFRDPQTGLVKTDLTEHCSCAACGRDCPFACFRKSGFNYVRCSFCGTVYINPQLREETVAEFWTRSAAAEAWARVLLHPAQREFDTVKYRTALEDLAKSGATDGRLLDFGSGIGLFVSLAEEHGFASFGVEPGPAARSVARAEFGVHLAPSLEELGEGQFDVITAWEVLEHTKQPLEHLRRLRERIRPDGKLIVLVGGNAASLANRIMQGKSAAFDFARFWYFTPDSFRVLLERADWEAASFEQMLDETDVVASYLGYGDPYRPAQFSEDVLSPALIRAMKEEAARGMGYKFKVIARPI